MKEITSLIEEEIFFVTDLTSDQAKKLEEVLRCEKTFDLGMEEYEAYAKLCRTEPDFGKLVDGAYDFWCDYKDYLWKVPGNGNFKRNWL